MPWSGAYGPVFVEGATCGWGTYNYATLIPDIPQIQSNKVDH